MKLSAEMQRAYDMAKANGDVLLRYPGGFWAPKGWKEPGRDYSLPKNYVTFQTIEALVKRGAAYYSAFQQRRSGGEFAIAVTIKAIA